MGLFDTFKVDVNLNLDRKLFFPGNILTGTVNLKVSSQMEFVGVRLHLKGTEFVKVQYEEEYWTQDAEGNDVEETRTLYTDKTTDIYEQVVTLAGAMKCSGDRTVQQMPQGDWVYPFQVMLPANLPPSMYLDDTCLDVKLKYEVFCEVDIPSGFDASSSAQQFTVLSAIPASQWAQPCPVCEDDDLDVTCCCCIDKGNVSVRAWMDRSVVALDRDEIQVYFGVDNTNGEEPVEQINVKLINHMEGYANGEENEGQKTISKIKITENLPCPAGEKREVRGVLKLPPLANPTCASMNVASWYVVWVEFEIPYATDPELELDMVVAGSVDDTNFVAPATIGHVNKTYQAVYPPEVYYVPPPQVQNVCMMPIQAPANAVMWTPPTQYYQSTPGAIFTNAQVV